MPERAIVNQRDSRVIESEITKMEKKLVELKKALWMAKTQEMR